MPTGFLRYFEENYAGPGARFPTHTWSVHNATLSVTSRTTNFTEQSHRMLCKKMGGRKPSVARGVRGLREVAELSLLSIAEFDRGHAKMRPAKDLRVEQSKARLLKDWPKYTNADKVATLLALAHNGGFDTDF